MSNDERDRVRNPSTIEVSHREYSNVDRYRQGALGRCFHCGKVPSDHSMVGLFCPRPGLPAVEGRSGDRRKPHLWDEGDGALDWPKDRVSKL